ncbi:hemocytin [Bicyclus anynana]|uniref:Hemocytin n=1 Tax=Bicyclus anynana TaxID=110368 RepID=A0A6J1MMY8_BICAN|nr:hemocytin [Bicyclus anynana]
MYFHFICVILIITSVVSVTSSQYDPVGSGCSPVVKILPKKSAILTQSRGTRGQCESKDDLQDYRLCSGHCHSGYVVNGESGIRSQPFDEQCQCCRVTKYALLPVTLYCDDGSQVSDNVVVHEQCSCRRCDDTWQPTVPNNNSKKPVVTGRPF